MSITACTTNQFRQDMLNGRAFSSDTFKVALYTQAAASLGPTTTVYTTTGEITGTGYTAGGATLSGFTVGLSGNVAYLTWTSPAWASSTITADSALIYDSTNSNHAVAALAFGSTSSSGGTWTLAMPAAGASAVITVV